jgi:hypothetical protein
MALGPGSAPRLSLPDRQYALAEVEACVGLRYSTIDRIDKGTGECPETHEKCFEPIPK